MISWGHALIQSATERISFKRFLKGVSVCFSYKSVLSTLIVVGLTSSNVIGQLVDAASNWLSWSWRVVGKRIVTTGLLLGPILLRWRILLRWSVLRITSARLLLDVVVVLGLGLGLVLRSSGSLIGSWIVLWLRLVGRLGSYRCRCRGSFGDVVSFSFEPFFACGVPDNLLLTRGI